MSTQFEKHFFQFSKHFSTKTQAKPKAQQHPFHSKKFPQWLNLEKLIQMLVKQKGFLKKKEEEEKMRLIP